MLGGTPAAVGIVQQLVKDALPVRPTPTSSTKPATLSGPVLQVEATMIEALKGFGVPTVKNTEKLPKAKTYPNDAVL